MSSAASGDGAHNAKQVVFLFMAATVVAVVVFLCGVLVGRGVPLTGRGATVVTTGLGYSDVPSITIGIPRSEPSAASAESEDLSYYRLLTSDKPRFVPDHALSSSEPATSPASDQQGADFGAIQGSVPQTSGRLELPLATSLEAAAVTEAIDTVDRVAIETVSPPAGNGYYVQVVALSDKGSVSGVVERLRAKGLPAFAVTPVADEPIALHRIRVGPYANRAEAERVRQRVEIEDEFAPIVTR